MGLVNLGSLGLGITECKGKDFEVEKKSRFFELCALCMNLRVSAFKKGWVFAENKVRNGNCNASKFGRDERGTRGLGKKLCLFSRVGSSYYITKEHDLLGDY